ncbi:MAG: ATP-binding protein [Candidatus Acidiferrales bacterium]
MSETAEKIDRISDAGIFETLAIQVLRELDKDCEAILHLGLNPVGKPVPGPTDGFGRVAGSIPSKYAIAAFTTIRSDKLEQKWLGISRVARNSKSKARKKRKVKAKGGSSESGDLIKAFNDIRSIRAVEPDAHFVVYLCTNRILDSKLMKKVWAFAAGRKQVEVRFLDQSRLRDFLDSTPEGQWLRREHLGVGVEQVSASLLRTASRASFQEYSASILAPTSQTIVTEQARRALKALENRSLSLQLLVGPSGIGKSVVGSQLHRSIIDAGRFAFWIPAEIVERSTTLGEALDAVLRSIYPTLMVGAGSRSIQIASEAAPLFVVIDDINRLAAPENALRKILGWAQPQDSTSEKASPIAAQQIVCPVWDSYWGSIPGGDTRSWVGIQAMRPFVRHESLDVLRAGLTGPVHFHAAELEQFADALKDDPILLGLFIETLTLNTDRSPAAIAADVLRSWTEAAMAELSRETHEPATSYARALEKLAAEMVVRKRLYPTVAEFRSWFGDNDETVRLLLLLAEAGHICHIGRRYPTPTFEFRHDRILEFFIAGAFARMLEDNGQDNPAAWDPFFTLFVGQAIGRRVFADGVLDQLLAHNANALIASLPYVDDGDPKYAASVKQRVRVWLMNKSSAPLQEWYHGLAILREISSKAVLEVTDGIHGGPILFEGRLRNGDAAAGAYVLASRFWPSIQAPWMEAIIAQATLRHKPKMLSELQDLLGSPDSSDATRCGALVLAGYIGNAQMIGAIGKCWATSKDKQKMVLPALWAALRCADARPEDSIGMMLPVVLELQDDPTGQTYSRQHSVLQDIGWSSRHGFTEVALKYLLDLGQTEEYLRVVVAILSEIPSATTVSFTVRRIAEWSNQAKQGGGFSPFAMSWPDQWRRWRAQGRIPDPCIDELRKMWEKQSEPEWVREYALRVWNSAAGDLDVLRSVSADDVLYESAIWYRMLKGDRGVTQDVISMLAVKPWWIEQIPKIWSEQLEAVLKAHLERHIAALPTSLWSNEDYSLAHVIRDIPAAGGENLLAEYWEKLRARPLFVQAALYVSTDRTRKLAAGALEDADKNTFEHIGSFFGFMTSGLVDRLSMKHLESLRPYFRLMDDMTIAEIVDFCGKHGLLTWARTYVLPECERRRGQYSLDGDQQRPGYIESYISQWMPSKENIFAQLDQMKGEDQHLVFRLELLSKAFLERGDSIDSFCDITREWFSVEPSIARLPVLATVIQYWGRRSDLPFLDSAYESVGDASFRPVFGDVRFMVERRSLS